MIAILALIKALISSLLIYHCPDILHGASQHGTLSSLDDGALDEVRVLDHERDQFVICERAARQLKLAINGLARAQQGARGELHLRQQLPQLFMAERRGVVIYLLVRDTALTEQPVDLTALGSRRLFIDSKHKNCPLSVVRGQLLIECTDMLNRQRSSYHSETTNN